VVKDDNKQLISWWVSINVVKHLWPTLVQHKGSDLVEWLYVNVEGFFDRRHARKYASLLLKVSLILV